MNKVPVEFNGTEMGAIQIAPSVFESIASTAALAVPGVAQMSSGIVQDFFGKKGVKIEIGADSVEIHISIYIDYGMPIPPIVRQIQVRVREDVEEMTGFLVKACHVNVQGVQVPELDKKRTAT
jgi:uncharacterized alkaline shock family protein YloU